MNLLNVMSRLNGIAGGGPLARLLAVAAVFAGLVGWFVHDQRKIGGQKVIAKVEKANATAIKRAESAALRSRDPAARGVLDPYLRATD
jgi:hypothetical protein